MQLLSKFYHSVSAATCLTLPADFVAASKRVRNVPDCQAVFEFSGLLRGGTLRDGAVDAVYSHSLSLRNEGLALEPNLLGRTVLLFIPDHGQQAAAAELFAARDTDFEEWLRQADAHRDMGAFVESEYGYFRCLQLYPTHINANIQYAHSLKEQATYYDALLRYLDAAALGAPLHQVEEHAVFVAEHLNIRCQVLRRLANPRECLLSNEVMRIEEILIGTRSHNGDLLQLMLLHDEMSSLIPAIVETHRFALANKFLLRLISENGV